MRDTATHSQAGLYDAASIGRLKMFIRLGGGLRRAGRKLNVLPPTLLRVLQGRAVRRVSRRKIELAIGPLTVGRTPGRRLASSGGGSRTPPSFYAHLPCVAALKAYLAIGHGVREAALRLDVFGSSLVKLLRGRPVHHVTLTKVEQRIERGLLGIRIVGRRPICRDGIPGASDVHLTCIAAIRAYLAEGGSLQEAASRLRVRSATLKRLLRGRPGRHATLARIERRVKRGALTPWVAPRTETSLSSARLACRVSLRAFLAKGGSRQEAALRLRVYRRTLAKLLRGRPVAPVTLTKVEQRIKRGVLRRSLRTVVQPEKVAQARRLQRLYQRYGTLEAVGQRMGVTKQAVWSLLVQWSRRGVISYRPLKHRAVFQPRISKSKLLQDYRRVLSFTQVARLNKLPKEHVARASQIYGITEAELERIRRERWRQEYLARYLQLAGRLGYRPNTSRMYEAGYGGLTSRILKSWGSFRAFKRTLVNRVRSQTRPSSSAGAVHLGTSVP